MKVAPNKNETMRQESARRHIGERVLSTSGMEMEIVEWHNSSDITVRFEDGAIRHCQYSAFKLGHVSPYPGRNSISIRMAFERVGETNINKFNRMKMIVSRYWNASDISVKFEDGTEVNSSYSAFKRGEVRHPSHKKRTKTSHIGEVSVDTDGKPITLIRFTSSDDVSVRFEDGTEINHIDYDAFRFGSVRHPLSVNTSGRRFKSAPTEVRNDVDIVSHTIGSMVYENEYKTVRGVRQWKCHCVLCGYEDYMSIQQMKEHNCHNKQNSTQDKLKDLAEKLGEEMEF